MNLYVNSQIIKDVKIGSQIWIAHNLDGTTFRNGDRILEAKTDEEWKKASDNKQPAFCSYNNDRNISDGYGFLYNWYAINDPRGLAPEGYHIPSNNEWEILSNFLGKDKAGNKMKEKSGWMNNGNGSNSSNFHGQPGGKRVETGLFYNFGDTGYYWTSSENSYGYIRRYISSESDELKGFHTYAAEGCSVRCIRD